MLQPQIEQILAQHCAPTLLGAKAASLVALSSRRFRCPEEMISLCSQELGTDGLIFTQLRSCPEDALMLVYRPALLEKQLQSPQAVRILAHYGYPVEEGLESMLEYLRHRLAAQEGFPHEIGLFLDYPPEDVEGFIRNRGNACKLSRYWKVYCDVPQAEAKFACYDVCRQCLCGLIASGHTISQLLKTA